MSPVDERVRDRLRDQPLPGEPDAAARTWPVVEAALAERAVRTRRRRVVPRLALAAAVIGSALVAALTPAGAWITERFDANSESGSPPFAALPKGGSVLAIARTGAYAVDGDGGTQWLGSFAEAGWSPHGEHVVGVDGRRLVAVDPRGTLKWSLVRPSRVHHPAWSLGNGFAVAYLEGSTLRVIAGDGDPATERPLRRLVGPVTPAWRPESDRVLALATTRGRVEALDTQTARALWAARLPGNPVALAWAPGSRRLVGLSSRAVTVLAAGGRELVTVPLPGVGRELALHPSGTRAAVVVSRGGESRVMEVPLPGRAAGAHREAAAPAGDAPVPAREAAAPRQLFQGGVAGLAWSPDGRHLLIGWRDTGQWLLLGPRGHIRALHGVSRELGASGGFPRVIDWCCG